MSVDQLKTFLARMHDDPSLREAVQGSATAGGSLRARERASCWMPMENPPWTLNHQRVPTRPLAGHGGQRGWKDLAIQLLRTRQWEDDENHLLRPLAHPAAQSWLGGLGATQ